MLYGVILKMSIITEKLRRKINNIIIKMFISKSLKETFVNQNNMYYDYFIFMSDYKYKKKKKIKKNNKKILKDITKKLNERERRGF